jgi:hemerythrin-like domain-containing protein
MNKDGQRGTLAFPGQSSPSASFDDPVAMLFECHNRVRISLDLLQKICVHLKTKGQNGHTASAATDVLRYFDIAAPLHHQDEELHVFPALRRSHVVAIQTYVGRAQADHVRISDQWSVLRRVLLDLASGKTKTMWSQTFSDQVQSFVATHEEHLSIEEQLLFPALAMSVVAEELEDIGLEMQQRRSASVMKR